MTRRSPNHIVARKVLAALAIAAGAMLAMPVGAKAVPVSMEPASQETIVPVRTPGATVSASQASPLKSGLVESSGMSHPVGVARGMVRLARSTPSGPRAEWLVSGRKAGPSTVPNDATPHPVLHTASTFGLTAADLDTSTLQPTAVALSANESLVLVDPTVCVDA